MKVQRQFTDLTRPSTFFRIQIEFLVFQVIRECTFFPCFTGWISKSLKSLNSLSDKMVDQAIAGI
jgi:hypothetical protein